MNVLNPDNNYFIAFDQLDLGFDSEAPEYLNRLIGLLLASRDINLSAKMSNIKLFIVIFLRDDIYSCLHFEDKNKMTENFVSFIEWDTERTKKTLTSLMEKRFNIVISDSVADKISWNDVFTEDREMPGHQSKYSYIRDRTYLRPRDIIKFTNCALENFKSRHSDESAIDHPHKIDNIDIHNSKEGYSEYFLREIDDEVHKHIPEYEKYLDVLRSIGTWQFDKEQFELIYKKQFPEFDIKPENALEKLFDFSIISFYKAGGRGFGGSEYTFKYKEPRVRFDHTSPRFRVHPGLIEVLGLKRT